MRFWERKQLSREKSHKYKLHLLYIRVSCLECTLQSSENKWSSRSLPTGEKLRSNYPKPANFYWCKQSDTLKRYLLLGCPEPKENFIMEEVNCYSSFNNDSIIIFQSNWRSHSKTCPLAVCKIELSLSLVFVFP